MANEWLSRLNHCKLLVKAQKRGVHKGTRTSRMIGSSFDFSDYRQYHAGDDIRQIDWNVYGRTEKLYIKRFLDEQELSVAIYLDCTKSMEVLNSKWSLAKQLAAAFCYIGLVNDDRVSFYPVATNTTPLINKKGSLYSKQIFHHIHDLSIEKSEEYFTKAAERYLSKQHQLIIIISDGLEELSKLDSLFRKMAVSAKEVRFLQILGNEELHPAFSSDLKLVDSENQSEVNVSMSEKVFRMYEERLKVHNDKLAGLLRRYSFSYLQVSDVETLQSILFTQCVKKGWIEGR